MRFHGTNVVSCELVSGDQQMRIIGAYLPLSTLDHLLDLEESLNRFLGIADIGRFWNPQDQQVQYLLMVFGLVDILVCFQYILHYRNL